MADREFDINVHISGDSGNLKQDLAGLQGELKSFRSDLADFNKSLGAAGLQLDEVASRARKLSVDLGYADRALGSLTRFTRQARDEMKDLVSSLKDSSRSLTEDAAATKILSEAKQNLAARINAELAPALSRQNDLLGSLSRRMVMTGDATGDLAKQQREAALAAELESRALDSVGDSAEKAAAKLTLMSHAEEAAGRAAVGGGILSRLGSAMSGTDVKGALYHRGVLGGLPWWLGGRVLGGVAAGGILPMTGLGPERLVTSALAIGGSAAAGAAGGAVVGSGVLGSTAVGGGSDMAVMKSTIADTKTLYQNYTSLQDAVSTYGAKSRQAVQAQLQLNQSIRDLGPAAGVELQLAKSVAALNTMWDKVTANARENAVKILDQVVGLGKDYVGRVAEAARQNLGIINQDIKPLFSWLEGPQGIKIWNDLENKFKQNLPYAVDAFNQAVQLLLKTMDYASQHSGGFIEHLDKLLNRLNSPSFALDAHLQKLIDDFRIWEQFLKYLMLDIVALVHQGAGEGNTLIELFTQWLVKFHEWETSINGSQTLHTFFKQRADELKALLQLLPPIISGFGKFYLALQPLVPVWTTIFKGINSVVGALEKVNPAATTALAGFLMFRKYLGVGLSAKGLTSPVAVPVGGVTAAEGEAGLAGVVAGTSAARAGIAATTGLTGAVEGDMGFGSAVSASLEGGVVGGIAGGLGKVGGLFQKAAPMLKVGAALWLGTSIISGIMDGIKAKQEPFAAGLRGFLQSVVPGGGKSLADLILGSNDIGTTIKGAASSIQDMQKALSSNSWGDVFRTLDGLKLKFDEAGGAARNQLGDAITKVEQFIAATRGFGDVTPAMAQKVITSFLNIKNQGGSYIQNMTDQVQQNSQMIAADVGTGTRQARDDLALNFATAARDMEQSYRQMGVSTSKAMQFINQQLVKALTMLGVPTKDFKNVNFNAGTAQYLQSTVSTVTSLGTGALNDSGATLNHRGAAIGGILGDPNAGGRDMYHVVMGEGEAVVTRHQRAALDSMLPGNVSVAGVVGAIKTPNYAAAGFIGGAANMASDVALPLPKQYLGGGSVDQGVDYSAPAGTPEYAMGPGRIIREGISGFGPNAPVEQITGGPLAGKEIYYGHAGPDLVRVGQGVRAGQQISEVGAGIVGISTGPHLEVGFYPPGSMGSGAAMLSVIHGLMSGNVLAPQFSSGPGGATGAGAPIAPTLPNAHVGMDGMLGQIAQKAVDTYHSAAQQYVNNLAGGGGISGGRTSAGGAYNKGQLERLWTQAGGPPNVANLMAAIALAESAGNPSIVNSIGASGLWQIHPPMPNDLNPMQNAKDAVMKYKTQGLTAWETYTNGSYRQFMRDGGVLGMAGDTSLTRHNNTFKPPKHGSSSSSTHKYSKVNTKPGAHRPKQLGKVKNIPSLPGLVDAFSYFWDTHTSNEDGIINYNGQVGLTDLFKASPGYISYAGGNAAALDKAGGNFSLLQNILSLTDDSDPQTNAPLTGPSWAYGPDEFYPGNPENNAGYAGVWKLDQQVAAEKAILQMMLDENSGSKSELSRLGGWVKNTKGTLNSVLGRAVKEQTELTSLQHYDHYVRYTRSQQNFGLERQRIHEKFTKLRSDLTTKRLGQRLSLSLWYNKARGILQDERRWQIAGIDPNLAPAFKATEEASITNLFDDRLTNLQSARTKTSTSDMINSGQARTFLSIAESDALFNISNQQHGYTKKEGSLGYLIYQVGQTLTQNKKQSSEVLSDLLAGNANQVGGKETNLLGKLGIDKTTLPGFGGTDIYSEIKQRQVALNDPSSGIPYISQFLIPSLNKSRDQIAGGTTLTQNQTSQSSGLQQLIDQQALYTAEQNSVQTAQLAALLGFTPTLASMVGSFSKGGVIPETGYALVHRDETVLPDPQGPFGTQGGVNGEAPTVIVQPVIKLEGSLAPLQQYIETVVEKTAQRVVSKQTGARTRALSGAPGRY